MAVCRRSSRKASCPPLEPRLAAVGARLCHSAGGRCASAKARPHTTTPSLSPSRAEVTAALGNPRPGNELACMRGSPAASAAAS